MCGAYALLWRFLHALLFAQRALFAWFREQLAGRGSWLRRWRRGAASVAAAASRALLVPAAATGVFAFHKPAAAGRKPQSNQSRWRRDGKSLQKLPGHVGLVVTEEEPSYADMASLVVWCMAVGISYVSVYDHEGELPSAAPSTAPSASLSVGSPPSASGGASSGRIAFRCHCGPHALRRAGCCLSACEVGMGWKQVGRSRVSRTKRRLWLGSSRVS